MGHRDRLARHPICLVIFRSAKITLDAVQDKFRPLGRESPVSSP